MHALANVVRISLFAILLAGPAAAKPQPAHYTFTLLDYPGANAHIIARGINNRGDVVGQLAEPPDGGSDAGFIRSRGEYILVRYPGATMTDFVGINERGQTVGVATVDGVLVHFLYERGSFTPLSLPGLPTDLNNRGEIVGSHVDGTGTHGFRYRDGVVETIDVPGSTITVVSGINDIGEIVGWYEAAGMSVRGFIEQDGEFATLAFPGALETRAVDINNRGDIVGQLQQSLGVRGFVYDGEFHAFVVPESVHCEGGNAYPATFPDGINERGVIVGEWYGYAAGEFGGFVATPSRRPGAAELPPCE